MIPDMIKEVARDLRKNMKGLVFLKNLRKEHFLQNLLLRNVWKELRLKEELIKIIYEQVNN